ncbi:MAG: cyclic nucleotide-binding domain-containing protein [Actinobacteria bacterium]|nr:cyclic nucleotide-binding domain-containing protein [Actinomycetota bacterium]
MARRDTYLEHLSSVPLFSSCTRKDLQRIAKASDEIHLDAGKVLVEQGETGRECYVVIEGQAAVRRGGRKVASLGPGDTVGELALLDHGPRTATVVADTPMDVLVLSSREFAAVLDDVPAMARRLMAALAARIRELDKKAFD